MVVRVLKSAIKWIGRQQRSRKKIDGGESQGDK